MQLGNEHWTTPGTPTIPSYRAASALMTRAFTTTQAQASQGQYSARDAALMRHTDHIPMPAAIQAIASGLIFSMGLHLLVLRRGRHECASGSG